jgi:molecular chaperone GrpE
MIDKHIYKEREYLRMEKENRNAADEVEIKDETLEQSEILEDKEFEELDEDSIVSLEGLVEELQDSNNKLQNEVDSLKDRLLRLNAEYDNYRKRTAKEKEGIYTDACEDILKNMLPVLDNLQRAASVEGSVEDIKKGIEMTIRQFNDSLTKLQVEEISTSEGFDPNLHNAVMHVEDDSFGKNEVVEVFQKGYSRNGKVLRHSMVKVAN